MSNRFRNGRVVVWVVLTLLAAGPLAAGGHRRVIVRAPKPYAQIENALRNLGAVVTERYENVDALAVSVPETALNDVSALVGADKISDDRLVRLPRPIDSMGHGRKIATPQLEAESFEPLDAAALAARPADYQFNNSTIGADVLHGGGNLGQDVVVAVIDSGTASSPAVPALSLAGQVLGGESFVTGDAVASPTSRLNDAHGTWVGTVIAGNVAFSYSNGSAFIQALKRYAPGAISGACPDPPTAATCRVPMVGVAPLAKLYAMKVFASDSESTAESVIIAAMDRAITLRRNFNTGVPSVPVAGDGSEDNPFKYDSLNIQVVNMSLGGGTGFAGRDLEDQLTTKMIREGIAIVASAGNDGFAAMTVGSPGSGFGALTVGATSDAAHERIVADLFLCGAGCGTQFRPSDAVQTADFSSRGPTADGRVDPDLTAPGVWTWAQGTCQGRAACVAGTGLAPLNFVSGTSFSAPTASGAAALLRRALPDAAAAEVRNALILGADRRLLADDSRRNDQGHGFLNVAAALGKLQQGRASNRIERSVASPSVLANVLRLGVTPVHFRDDVFSTHVGRLKPGEVAQFFVPSDAWTDRIVVKLRNVSPELPPEQQNPLFGDDVLVRIADAPTSFWSSPCVLPPASGCEAYVAAEQTINIENPQTGLVRVALQGDWTNAGKVSTDLVIERTRGPLARPTAVGRIQQGDLVPVQVEVPPGTAQLAFELAWEGNWSRYPTNDLDLIILDPNTQPSFEGATFASPERVVIDGPPAGVWTAYIQGFTVHDRYAGGPEPRDEYALRVTADGVRLPAVQ
jgi:hypothetical protein